METEGVAGEITSSNGDDGNRLASINPCGPRKTNESNGEDRPCDGLDLGRTNDDTFNDSIVHSYASLESVILHLLYPEPSSRSLVLHPLDLWTHLLF